MTKKPLLLDGAMGTLLLNLGFKAPFEELSLTHPKVIQEIHLSYLKAGSQALLTHTFHAQTKEQCEASWNLMKDLTVKKFVSIGPEANREVILDFFQDKDCRLVFETIYHLGLAKELIEGYHQLNPIFSFTLRPSDLKEALRMLDDYSLKTIGLNCLDGFKEAPKLLELIPSSYEIYFKPNSGSQKLAPDEYAKNFESIIMNFPLNYLGGCCGTTPAHIKAIADSLDNFVFL